MIFMALGLGLGLGDLRWTGTHSLNPHLNLTPQKNKHFDKTAAIFKTACILTYPSFRDIVVSAALRHKQYFLCYSRDNLSGECI